MPVFYQDLSLIFFFSNHIVCTARFTLTSQDTGVNRNITQSQLPRPSRPLSFLSYIFSSTRAGCMHHPFSSCVLPMLLCLSLAVPSFLPSCLFLYPPHSLALNPQPLMQPRAPSPDTFEGLNIKQVYKAFAAVPHSLAVLEPPQVGQMLLKVVSMSWSPSSSAWSHILRVGRLSCCCCA